MAKSQDFTRSAKRAAKDAQKRAEKYGKKLRKDAKRTTRAVGKNYGKLSAGQKTGIFAVAIFAIAAIGAAIGRSTNR